MTSMAQHFLLSKAAKTLGLAQVFRMSDEKAEEMFRLIRWAETKGAPVCPHCGGVDAYDCRRRMALHGSAAALAARISA